MQGRPSSYPDKRMSPDKKRRVTISSEESSFIPKKYPQHPSEGSPPSTKDTKRYSVKKSCRDYPDILSGIMRLNYFPEPLHHCPDDSSPLLRAKSLKHRNS